MSIGVKEEKKTSTQSAQSNTHKTTHTHTHNQKTIKNQHNQNRLSSMPSPNQT